jgi:ferredoxin-NADP reductase
VTEPPPARARIPWRLAQVLEVAPETARARNLFLKVPDWPGHLPGQHVDLRLTADDGYQVQRSYSIASAPEDPAVVLTVERIDDGEVSPFLTDELRPGDTLELRGPIGGYFTWTTAQGGPLQLLAGGSGVVPLMAMLRHRAGQGAAAPARLLGSWRTLDSIFYRTELQRLVGADPTLQVTHTLTRERPDGWTGRLGRVDAAMLAAQAFPPAQKPDVYVCGPTPFVESVAGLLVAAGHKPGRIRTERFGPTGG